MPNWAVTVLVIYYLVACLILFILMAGIDRYDETVVKYGMYRGITLEVVVRLLIAAFWLPYALFFYIRGLARGE